MAAAALRLAAIAVLVWAAWLMWRTLRSDPAVERIAGIGLAVRALAGASLFWVSYLALPLGRSLQRGNGLWFIAEDADLYFPPAAAAAAGGLGAIWGLDPTLPSVFYIQMLALVMWIGSPVVSAALLLNAVAFLAMCWCVNRLAILTGAPRRARLFALAAVGFSPAWILWATHPLKDTVFVALVAGYVLALAHWTGTLRNRSSSLPALLAGAGALWGVVYAVSGIRWYFGLLLLAGTAVAAVVSLLQSPGRRVLRAAAAMVTMLVLTQAVTTGAGPFLPQWGHEALSPWTGRRALESLQEIPAQSVAVANKVRDGLIEAGGGTEIRLGESAPSVAAPGVAAPSVAAPRRPATAFEKTFAGAVAMVVPRVVAQALGLIEVGGGRGLWAFAELDTVVLDLVLVGAGFLVFLQLRQGRVPLPAFWGLLVVTALIAAGLAYEGSNFGTLFRQRGMAAVGVMLLPLLLAPRSGPRTSGATTRS